MLLLRILFVFSVSSVVSEPFQQVSDSCIHWDSLDLHSDGDTDMLHCILDGNDQLGIVKVRWKWVANGSCPYYDRSGKQINTKPCDTELGSCPDKDIFSFQAVNYSACITGKRNVSSFSDSTVSQGIGSSISQVISDVNRNSKTLSGILAVSISTFIAVVGIIIQLTWMEKKRCNLKGEVHLYQELQRRDKEYPYNRDYQVCEEPNSRRSNDPDTKSEDQYDDVDISSKRY